MDSILAVFDFGASQGRYFVDEHGYLWFALTDVLAMAKTSTNPSQAQSIIGEVFDDGVKNVYPIPDSMGREQETLFIHESAVTFLVSRFRTEVGKALNRFIHKELLPTIRKTGGYIAPNASKEQLEALQAQIQEQQLQIDELTSQVKVLDDYNDQLRLIADFLDCNIAYAPKQYVMSADVIKRFRQWVGKKSSPLFTNSQVLMLIDIHIKRLPLPKEKRIYISQDGGYGDLENARLIPVTEVAANSWKLVCQIGE